MNASCKIRFVPFGCFSFFRRCMLELVLLACFQSMYESKPCERDIQSHCRAMRYEYIYIKRNLRISSIKYERYSTENSMPILRIHTYIVISFCRRFFMVYSYGIHILCSSQVIYQHFLTFRNCKEEHTLAIVQKFTNSRCSIFSI